MISLDDGVRKLIIECGLAAVNNGLYLEAESIRNTLPCLTENEHARNIIDITMLIGMNNLYLAQEKLQGNLSHEAEILRQLIHHINHQ